MEFTGFFEENEEKFTAKDKHQARTIFTNIVVDREWSGLSKGMIRQMVQIVERKQKPKVKRQARFIVEKVVEISKEAREDA